MLQLTEEELGEIIELTEKMCTRNGWVNEIAPPAKKRMEIINRARTRPQPKEHCDHECVCAVLAIDGIEGDKSPCDFSGCLHDTRSRPHQAPAERLGFTEFCYVHCDKHECCTNECERSGYEAARQAREDVLDKIMWYMVNHGVEKRPEGYYVISGTFSLGGFIKHIESLRTTTPHTEQEQPR